MRALATPSRSFLCFRHGVTDWNRQGLFQGFTDIPLNDEGIAQAQAAAQQLRDVKLRLVVSSPLIRAVKTAEIMPSLRPGPSPSIRAIATPICIECIVGTFGDGRAVADFWPRQHCRGGSL